jgi:mannitol operon repressor
MPSSRKSTRAEAAAKIADLQGFAAEFQNEGDRAAAILAAALLDERLRQLLTAYLIDDSKEVALLLDQEQSLGSFGARMRAAYCLGLLDKDLYGLLSGIKKVRNAFAHQLHGLTFESPGIANDCKVLRDILRFPAGFEDLASTPRAVFIRATFSAQSGLWAQSTSYEVNGRRCKVPEWQTLVHWKRDENPQSESPKK